ncbi:hypothetical protein [Pandoravirus japonicus]|uniref:Uncharacterized protein n=1 Tax=Pandoravirus japonicus TaxID=2823154 RepID=A0A811BPX7_9VIRU|nr:hypothetical protein [Pandoravirus japonicus]
MWSYPIAQRALAPPRNAEIRKCTKGAQADRSPRDASDRHRRKEKRIQREKDLDGNADSDKNKAGGDLARGRPLSS